MPTVSVRSLFKFVVLVLFLGGALFVLRGTEIGRRITIEAVRTWIGSFDPLLAPLIYIGVYIIGTVVFFPAIVLSFCGAILFGAYEGTLYTWVGATIGSTLAYLLAKYLGRDFVEQLLGGRFAEFERRVEKHGFTSLLILRLLPWFPMTGINFGSGLTRITLRDFVLATAIGILPGTFVYSYLFATLGDKVLRNEWQWSDLADVQVGVAVGMFVVFLGLVRWLSRRMRKTGDVANGRIR